jgi:hypothetical protein
MKTESILLGAVLGLNACRSATETAPARASAEPPRADAPSAQATLAELDRRTPVPLLPMMAHHQKENMRDHLVVVQEIVTSLGEDDFDGVARAARRIGSSPQMNAMCSHLGAGAPGFTEQALAFHRVADEIGSAARARDQAGVLSALGRTIGACTGCHATFKQEVVPELAEHH